MKDMSLRNVLLLLAAVIIALLVLGFVSTLLNQLIPITIALVVGVVLGRMSGSVDLRAVVWNAVRRQKPAKAEAPQTEAQPATDAEVQSEVEAIKQRIADTESPPEEEAEITDFDIKTEEEVLAEAQRREAEIAQKNAQYDPEAALAERRRRLLGDQADKS